MIKHRALYVGLDDEGRQVFQCPFCSYRVHLPMKDGQKLLTERGGVDLFVSHYGSVGGLEITGLEMEIGA